MVVSLRVVPGILGGAPEECQEIATNGVQPLGPLACQLHAQRPFVATVVSRGMD